MTARRNERIGKRPPRYIFALNPHGETRVSQCPRCRRKTNGRKFPLFIHIHEWGPILLGKTCRYCPDCEFIICHQDELEAELCEFFFAKHAPQFVGSPYFVLGTVELKTWKAGLQEKMPKTMDPLAHLADFRERMQLEFDPGGWRRAEP